MCMHAGADGIQQVIYSLFLTYLNKVRRAGILTHQSDFLKKNPCDAQ